MLTLALGIAAAIALGCLIVYAIVMTFRWLKNKIKENLQKKNVAKVACADLEKMIENCDNTVSIDSLESWENKGYTHVVANVGYDGKIEGEIELIKNEDSELDEDVERLLSKEGMVVVTG